MHVDLNESIHFSAFNEVEEIIAVIASPLLIQTKVTQLAKAHSEVQQQLQEINKMLRFGHGKVHAQIGKWYTGPFSKY